MDQLEPLSNVGPDGEGEAPLKPMRQAQADDGAEQDDPAPAPCWIIPLEQVGHLTPAEDSVLNVQILQIVSYVLTHFLTKALMPI